MSDASSAQDRTVTVATSDVEAGLKLLQAERSALRTVVVEDLNVGIFLFAVFTGLLVIWWDLAWGLALLGVALIACVFLVVLPQSPVWDTTKKLRSTVEAADTAGVTQRIKTPGRSSGLEDAIILLSLGAAGFALFMLVRHLIVDGAVLAWAIGVLALSAFVFWTAIGVGTFRDYRHYGRLAKTYDELKDQLEHSGESVEVSRSQIDVLSKAESSHTSREVKAALKQARDVAPSAWAISVTPDAKETLDELAASRPDVWANVMSAIHNLQFEPRPQGVRLTEPGEATVDVAAGGCAVDYRFEDASRRIYVLSVTGEGKSDGDV